MMRMRMKRMKKKKNVTKSDDERRSIEQSCVDNMNASQVLQQKNTIVKL